MGSGSGGRSSSAGSSHTAFDVRARHDLGRRGRAASQSRADLTRPRLALFGEAIGASNRPRDDGPSRRARWPSHGNLESCGERPFALAAITLAPRVAVDNNLTRRSRSPTRCRSPRSRARWPAVHVAPLRGRERASRGRDRRRGPWWGSSATARASCSSSEPSEPPAAARTGLLRPRAVLRRNSIGRLFGECCHPDRRGRPLAWTGRGSISPSTTKYERARRRQSTTITAHRAPPT